MWVQIAIILLGGYLLFRSLASPRSQALNAWKKIGLVLLVITMVVTVLNPDLTSALAHFAGVGRGTDLLVYAVTGAFLFYVVTQYLHDQRQRDVTFRLARRVALLEARSAYAEELSGLPQAEIGPGETHAAQEEAGPRHADAQAPVRGDPNEFERR